MKESTTINYSGEMSRPRYWQEAALRAMEALLVVHPPNSEEVDLAPAELEQYAKRIARAAHYMADEMHAQHGPSIATRLCEADPFTARGVQLDFADLTPANLVLP